MHTVRKWDGIGQMGDRGFRYVSADEQANPTEQISKAFASGGWAGGCSQAIAFRKSGQLSAQSFDAIYKRAAKEAFPLVKKPGMELQLFSQTVIGKQMMQTAVQTEYEEGQFALRRPGNAYDFLKGQRADSTMDGTDTSDHVNDNINDGREEPFSNCQKIEAETARRGIAQFGGNRSKAFDDMMKDPAWKAVWQKALAERVPGQETTATGRRGPHERGTAPGGPTFNTPVPHGNVG